MKEIARWWTISFSTFTLLTMAWVGPVSALTLDLVTGVPSVVNHYPSADSLVGTGDDLVSGAPTPINTSEPNSLGSYSYNAFDFGTGVTDAGLPPGKNAITFIQGTVSIDTNVAANGGGPLVSGFDLTGSEPFPFHGPYNAQIAAVNGGDYNPATGELTMNIDLAANFGGPPAIAPDFTVTGDAWFVEAANYGVGTGNTYVDNVLIPLAQNQNAASLFFAHISGTVPAAPGGFGAMPIEAVLVGVTPVPVPPAFFLLVIPLMGLVKLRVESSR